MLKKLWPYTKPYRWQMFSSPIMMILEVVTDIVVPLLMAQIVNIGIHNHDLNFVVKTGALMVAAAVCGGIFGTFSSYLGSTAGYGIACELRKDLYRHIQEYSFQNIDHMSAPSLITRLTTDVETVGMVVMMSLRMAIRTPFLMVFALIAAIGINAQLALVFLIAIPVIVVVLSISLRKAFPLFRSLQARVDAVNAVVQEQLAGIRVIKSFHRNKKAEADFAKYNDNLRDVAVKGIRIVVTIMPVMSAMIYLCIIAVMWFGGQQVMTGGMRPGDLIAFLTYIIQIMISLVMLSMYIINLTRGVTSLRRIFEAIDLKSEMQEAQTPVQALADGSVRFEHVTFKYPGYRDPILDDISFCVKSGEMLGIIGPTGSSKSTLVQMIPRLYDTDEGAIYVGGKDVRDYDMTRLRAGIGVVLQKNTLVSGTIRSNMLWGNEGACDEEIIEALKLSQAWEFVSQYKDGLDHPVEQGGSNFSGGQKQRLTIARALVKKPQIMILDDSTSAVDTTTDAKIRQGLAKSLPGVTVILVAQRISSIQNADQILVLNSGAVEALGTHEEVLQKSPIYREIYEAQQEGGLEE